MKKHVVIDARYINKPGTGIHTYLIGLLEALQSQDYSLTLLVDDNISAQAFNKEEVIVLKTRSRIIWEQVYLPRFLKKSHPDIFIAPANFGLPLFYRKRNTKLVLVIHDFIPVRFPLTYLLKRPFYLASLLLSTPISIYRADSILTNSKFTANEVAKFFHKKALNAYIPVNYGSLKARKSASKIAQREKYFLYNSGPDPRKQITTLIEGFNGFSKKHPKYKLLIMGKGYDKYKAYVNTKNYQNIVFLGYVDDTKKMTYIENAYAVITVSKMEGFGLPLIEAFSNGVPVLCGHNSALEEVAGSAAHYIEPLDIAGLTVALTTFGNLSATQRSQLINKGRERIEFFDNFNSKLVINQELSKLLLT